MLQELLAPSREAVRRCEEEVPRDELKYLEVIRPTTNQRKESLFLWRQTMFEPGIAANKNSTLGVAPLMPRVEYGPAFLITRIVILRTFCWGVGMDSVPS